MHTDTSIHIFKFDYMTLTSACFRVDPFKSSYESFDKINLKKSPYFSQVLLAPAEAIIGGINTEMTNTMMSHKHLYKEQEEVQLGGDFMKEKNFSGGKRKNWWE